MKKNVILWIGIALLVVGSVLSCFTDIYNDIPALAIAAFGLGTIVMTVWNKSEVKGPKVIASIVCITIAGFCCAVAGLAQETMTSLIAAIVAVVLLIVGILVGKVKIKG